jgi:predicted Zn-dependent protease
MLPWAAWQPAVALAQTANELPAIGSGADSTLTLDEEFQIGLSVVRGLREQGLVLEDPEADDYIQALGIRLASQIPDSRQRFKFFVVRDPAINAFALPGGFIGVNQGLITAAANEAQLAGVLAHEISHVTQRHIARSLQAQGRQGMASAAALLAAAGFDPNAMPDFFETLGRRTGLAGIGVPEFLRTHPVTANRIAESRDRAAQLRPAIAVQTQTWSYFRERVRVLGGPVQGDLRAYYAALADTRTLTPAQRYGEALAQLVNGERGKAVVTLRELAAAQPDSPMLQAALGQALVADGQPAEAIGLLRRALAVSPRNVPLTIRYAEALLRAGEAKEAHTVLLDLFNNVPPTPEQIRLTALAASSAGDTADAYYYMGEYHIAGGDLAMAVKQQELALADPDITPVQRARFEARKKEVEDVLKESGKRRQRESARPDGR